MAAIYDITMFLCIALLAVVVTVFVVAVSFLGRAIEEASREQAEIKQEEAKERDKTIEEMRAKLDQAKAPAEIRKLRRDLERYEKEARKFEEASRKAAGRYRPLTVEGSVLYPGVLFVISLVLAGGARYATTTTTLEWTAWVLWGLSLPALAFGCYRIHQSLKAVQSVAMVTEEAQHKRMVEALVVALDQHEEARRPALELEFREKQPPFSFKRDTEEIIKVRVILAKGDVARKAEAWFLAPEGFDFPGADKWNQPDDFTTLPGALTTKFELGDMKRLTYETRNLKIKAPPKAGEFRLFYELKCEGFNSKCEEFVVKVTS